MARVTVEDCLQKLNNRFELVMVAAKRARELASTAADPHLEWQNDKATVMALREIAGGHISADYLLEKPVVELEQVEETKEQPAEQATPVVEGTQAQGETSPQEQEASQAVAVEPPIFGQMDIQQPAAPDATSSNGHEDQ